MTAKSPSFRFCPKITVIFGQKFSVRKTTLGAVRRVFFVRKISGGNGLRSRQKGSGRQKNAIFGQSFQAALSDGSCPNLGCSPLWQFEPEGSGIPSLEAAQGRRKSADFV
jgi:hypothetical protein